VYRLTGRLEQSQLADLYRAERAGEAVVVKLFHLKTSDASYARVVGEVARQLQAVPHPGVARVLDVGLVDGQLAIVRQDAGKYTLGLALQRLNTREVHLPPALALALALELLDAVGAAHEAGVVHGALTPGNIVLGVDGQISATDFGALRALEASPALKKSFGARGRSSYRAPELGTGGEPTVASDVYALGAITYELLTLREASTGHATVSTRSERLPPPSRLVRRLHSRIDPVIMRALEPSAPRRHRSCRDFAEGIREFLASSGGMPGKADLAKFVSELFPNEVQVAATGPVPIERPFELTDIAGVGAIEAEAVEADDRKSFSGGYVDDRTPTSDGLPVFTGEPAPETLTETPVKTELEVVAVPKRAVSDWEAPPGELPATASQSGPTPRLNEALKGRMKAVEDFGEIPGQEKAPPRELPPEQAPKTIVSFVVPGQKPIDRYAIAQEERAIAERRIQRVRVMGALILTGTVLFVAWSWYRGQSDPKGALISYLPDPIERQIAPDTAPVASPVKSSNPLKLADFDKLHPEKAFHPETPTPAPPPKKTSDCFDPPSSGKLGYLTVAAMTSVRVDVDGKRVCVNATKLPLSVGAHKVKVTDVKSKQEDVSTIRVEAGKLVKLSPVFPKR
jgi:serine/threonine-protein kinase